MPAQAGGRPVPRNPLAQGRAPLQAAAAPPAGPPNWEEWRDGRRPINGPKKSMGEAPGALQVHCCHERLALHGRR